MSDNQRYYDIAEQHTWDKLSDEERACIDAVVAAVWEDAEVWAQSSDNPAMATLMEKLRREGRQDAARDCLATLDYGEQAARLYARIAEGGT